MGSCEKVDTMKREQCSSSAFENEKREHRKLSGEASLERRDILIYVHINHWNQQPGLEKEVEDKKEVKETGKGCHMHLTLRRRTSRWASKDPHMVYFR